MASILKCSPGCGKTEEWPSRYRALASGWTAATIETKSGVKYFLICPQCGMPKWAKDALATAAVKKTE